VAAGNGNGAGDGYATFQGAGFGTLLVSQVHGTHPTPQVASARAYLRDALPAIWQEGDFEMRFVGALEEVLDPTVGVLDGLHHYFSADLAPRPMLRLLGAWLGIEVDEALSLEAYRELVRRAGELGRGRGTVTGLRLALELSFPGLPLRVEDEGSVEWSTDPDHKVEAKAPRFIVYCDEPIPENKQAAVARVIESAKPVHASYRLRVKARKKPAAE